MQNLEQAKEKLSTAKSAVILSHKSPDGDSIGSSLATANFLEQRGIDVQVITPDAAPDFLNWLEGFNKIKNFDKEGESCLKSIENADLIFCLDFNDPMRVGGMQEALENAKGYKLNIDHHREPKDFCDFQYSDIKASSTAEMIHEFLHMIGADDTLNKGMAEAIYVGILTDTGSFRFSSTSAKTHAIVSTLIENGVEPDKIYREVYDSYSSERLKLLGYALYESLKLHLNEQVAIIALSSTELRKFNFKRGDTEGLVNYPLSIKNVKVSILLTEKDGLVKMSFRSKGEIAVNHFAKKYFSGGGHLNAAGGIGDSDMPSTVSKLESLLEELIP